MKWYIIFFSGRILDAFNEMKENSENNKNSVGHLEVMRAAINLWVLSTLSSILSWWSRDCWWTTKLTQHIYLLIQVALISICDCFFSMSHPFIHLFLHSVINVQFWNQQSIWYLLFIRKQQPFLISHLHSSWRRKLIMESHYSRFVFPLSVESPMSMENWLSSNLLSEILTQKISDLFRIPHSNYRLPKLKYSSKMQWRNKEFVFIQAYSINYSLLICPLLISFTSDWRCSFTLLHSRFLSDFRRESVEYRSQLSCIDNSLIIRYENLYFTICKSQC